VMANAVIEAQGGVVEKFADEEVIDVASDLEKVEQRDNKNKNFNNKNNNRKPENKDKRNFAPKAEAAPAKEEVKVDLSTLKVAELKELAKAKGIENYNDLKKAELIEALSK